MNVKASVKYLSYDYKKTVRWYYISMVSVILFLSFLSIIVKNSGGFTFGSMEFTTAVLAFIVGLYSFKESFFMMLQNGISRKTMFISRLITIFVTCLTLAAIDRLILNAGALLHKINDQLVIESLYDLMFETRIAKLNIVLANFEAIFVMMFIYMSVLLTGYFIAIAYYKMNKVLKIAVSISVPAVLFVFLPIIDYMVFKGQIARFIGKLLNFIFGRNTGTPYNLLITLLIFIAVCTGVCWLLIRKAVEK